MALGVDIGRKEIKIVRLEKSGGVYKLATAASKEIMEGARSFDPEQVKTPHITAALSSLLDEMDINPKRVKGLVSSLSGRQSNIKQITTVEMPTGELESSLQFEARKHIPLDGTDAVMDYEILGEDPKELDKINVLLIASTKKAMDHHTEVLEGAGLKPGVVDSDPLAITNTFMTQRQWPDEGATVLLNVGAISTSLVVWGRKQQFFTREMNMGGHDFTKAFVDHDEVDYQEAEKIKMEHGVHHLHTAGGTKGSGYAIEVETRTIFDNFVEELRRSLRYYVKQTNQSFFQNILVSGGSAILPGFTEFVSEKLNVEVESFNPVLTLDQQDLAQVENPGKYSVAIGLAIRGLS